MTCVHNGHKEQSPCAEIMLIPSLDISEQLKLNEITQITLLNLSDTNVSRRLKSNLVLNRSFYTPERAKVT